MTSSSLADIIRIHDEARSNSTALEYEGRSITFGDVQARACQMAQALLSLGVKSQDRVIFVGKNGPEFFEVMFGVGLINAVNVAMNWRLAPAEMAQIIVDAQAEVVIVGSDFVPQIETIEDQLPTVPTIIAMGGHARWLDYEVLVSAQIATDPGCVSAGGDVAFQIYTSGTTGIPKGVMLTNDNFLRSVVGIAEQWNLGPDSVNLAMMPLFHIAGLGWALVGFIYGCRTVLLRDIDPGLVLEVIPQFGITHALMVPAVIQMVLASPTIEQTDFSSLRIIVYGASPIADDVLLRGMEIFGCQFIQLYGLTETAGAVTQLDSIDHDPINRPNLLRSCGKPYPWIELRVVGDKGRDVAVGGVGELWTRSHQNMKGYWNNPGATEQAYSDGWFKTGDAGFMDAEGFVYLHDRVKDMIVSGGENIYPAEVENVLMRHPHVADVAVIAVPDEKWGEAVKAIVVPVEGAVTTEQDLIAFCRQDLAGYKIPKSVDFTDLLPRNASGKLLKRTIRESYWGEALRRIG